MTSGPTAGGGQAQWLRFRARIGIRGVNPFVLVSARRARTLREAWRKPMPVEVRLNGLPSSPWRINMMPVGSGAFYLYLNGVVRTASSTGVGDRVEVSVRFDARYRPGPMPMPAWFAAAIAKAKGARRSWDALPPSRQKEVLRYFAALKSEDARKRNLVRILSALSGTKTRFMARTWVRGA